MRLIFERNVDYPLVGDQLDLSESADELIAQANKLGFEYIAESDLVELMYELNEKVETILEHFE